MAGTHIKLNYAALRRLEQAATTALVQTAEAIHTDLQQSQTMPFRTGNLQNESTFVDDSEAAQGRVEIVSSTPYARRLYFHPEYNFFTGENPAAGGEWFAPYLPDGEKAKFAEKVFAAQYKRISGV